MRFCFFPICHVSVLMPLPLPRPSCPPHRRTMRRWHPTCPKKTLSCCFTFPVSCLAHIGSSSLASHSAARALVWTWHSTSSMRCVDWSSFLNVVVAYSVKKRGELWVASSSTCGSLCGVCGGGLFRAWAVTICNHINSDKSLCRQ